MIDLQWHKGHWIQLGALEVRGNQLHSSWNGCREESEVKNKTYNATVSETENRPLWWFFCLGAQLQPLWIGLVLLASQFYSPGLSLSAPPPFSAVQSVQQPLINYLLYMTRWWDYWAAEHGCVYTVGKPTFVVSCDSIVGTASSLRNCLPL